jgi:hypothetical protein
MVRIVLLALVVVGAAVVQARAAPSGAGSASRVTAKVVPTNWHGGCPHTFQLSATITARTPGTVTYHWERSDNSSTASQSVTFARAGQNKVVRIAWTLSASGVMHGWERLQVENGGPRSTPASFILQCKR